MKKRILSIAIALLATVVFAPLAFAHGGGLDGYGCHHNRKQGGYHCHRGPLAGQSFSSQSEMLNVLKSITPTSVSKKDSKKKSD